jgi:hypothetical protein
MPLFNDEASLIPSFHPGFALGKYYASTTFLSTTVVSFNPGYVYYTYYFVLFQQTFKRVAFQSNTTFSNTQNARLAIYKVVSGLPSTLVADLGVIYFISFGTKELSCSISLPAGWYAIGLMFSPNSISLVCPNTNINSLLGQTVPSVSTFSELRATLAYGSFPTIASLSNIADTNAPIIWLKAS